jgi:hypothetical protein
MWENIKKFVKDCLTGIDGESYDLGRVLWALAFLTGIGLEVFSVTESLKFDLQQYGIGVGALLVAGGASLHLKAKTEPQQ